MRMYSFLPLPVLFASTLASLSPRSIEDGDSPSYNPLTIRSCPDDVLVPGKPLLIRLEANNTGTTGRAATWNSFRLTLTKSTTLETTVGLPICTYSDCLPLDTTAVTVVVDPVWGPNGAWYNFAINAFNDTELHIPSNVRFNESGFSYVNGVRNINVTGMTGRFYDFESNPPSFEEGKNWPTRLPIYPCSAYQCARDCVDKEYVPGWNYWHFDAFDRIKACADACPGATTLINNCPNVGGVKATIADGVDPNRFPDHCREAADASTSTSAGSTPTSSRGQAIKDGIRMHLTLGCAFFVCVLSSLLLGVAF